MRVAIGRQHPMKEHIEDRSVAEAQHLREGRSGWAEARIFAQSVDVGEAQHKI